MKILFILLLSLSSLFACEKQVILGSGPAGLTAALFAAQGGLEPLVIEGLIEENLLASIQRIENYPGFPEAISGGDLSSRIQMQAEHFGARFLPTHARAVDLKSYPFQILLENGELVQSSALIIATGTSVKPLEVPGEAELKGKGVFSNALLECDRFQGKRVVVVGGGDSAIESALILAEKASRVALIYKGEKLYGASYLQKRLSEQPKVELLLETIVEEILGSRIGRLTQVALKKIKSDQRFFYPCSGLIVANGRRPNSDLFKEQLEMTADGYLITEPGSCRTSIPGVFAAGDIANNATGKLIGAAASGCQASREALSFLNNPK